MMLLDISIRFPHLGIELNEFGKSISVFGFNIAYYGIIIAFGMILGYLIVEWQAKRTNQDKEMYLDFALYAIILSIIGARLYYVLFNWSYYFSNPMEIFNIKAGGLAIYGGVITAVVTAYVYTKIKKINFWLFADTAVLGLTLGQIIGRWGNFFNREAFGDFTNNVFAMQIRKSEVATSNITQKMLDHIVTVDGVEYIQVHPTFLYESVWNLILLIFLIFYSKYKKFNGEIFCLYLVGYGLGRLWIEGLRTDQLHVWGTNIAVSQIVSIVAIITGLSFILIKRHKLKKEAIKIS